MAKRKKIILVIDDNEDIRNLLRLILENAGCTVLTAVDGADGLSQIRTATPDLILLDVLMPNMDGFEFLSQIRKDKDTKIKLIPILMLTAKSSVEDIDMAIDLGVTSYIVKPFRPEKLVQKVMSIFEGESF